MKGKWRTEIAWGAAPKRLIKLEILLYASERNMV